VTSATAWLDKTVPEHPPRAGSFTHTHTHTHTHNSTRDERETVNS